MKTFVFASLLGFFNFVACGEEEEKVTRTEPEGANPGECTDGADNDFDGEYDCNDSDCAGSPDCLESDCDDGADNDQDGDFDCDDSDCADAPECATEDDCADGADNDVDGLFDCADPDCAEDAACVDDFEGDEAGECTDGVDNDSDGLIDCDDPNCEGSPDCEDEVLGSQSNPGLSCKDILGSNGSIGDGNYWIEPQSDGSPYEVYCLMDSIYDGGGWTLISTHSDDGQDTWTWNNRHYFDTDTTTFGSLFAANEDFKSMALHDVEMQDLLFVHAPSGVWAGYNGVGLSNTSFSTFMLSYQTPSVYSPNSGFPMSSGNLVATNYLNETSLYFSAQEQDGGSGHSYGPTWNATFNSGVNFDDTPNSSLGPCASTTTTRIGPCNEIEWNTYYAGGYTGVLGVGYGFAIGENTGISGNAENYMQVFVR